MKEVKLTGTLVYDPSRIGFKKTHKMRTLIAMVRPGDIGEYYEYLIQQIYGPWATLHRPMYGYHVTVVSGKEGVPDMTAWKKHEGETVELTYDVESLQKNWSFWNFRVHCDRFKEIRSELKMKPDYHFHLTVGRDDTNLVKKFNKVNVNDIIQIIPKVGGNQVLKAELKFFMQFPTLGDEDAIQILRRHIPNPLETGREWEKKVFELVGEIHDRA
jgi:hypothetical protein